MSSWNKLKNRFLLKKKVALIVPLLIPFLSIILLTAWLVGTGDNIAILHATIEHGWIPFL